MPDDPAEAVNPPAPRDKRGQAGYPPAGRRAEDPMLHDLVAEMRAAHEELARIQAEMPRAPARTLKEWLGLGVLLATVVSSIVGAVVWFGGEVVGPGARFRREQKFADSIALIQRTALAAAVEQTSKDVARVNRTTARLGRDMCLYVYKREQATCFAEYDSERDAVERTGAARNGREGAP